MQPRSELRRLFDGRVKAGEARTVIEKDYAVSYVLAGIAAVPELYDIALFKGGTSLRKAYFANYRFSVDLDYTLTKRLPCEQVKSYAVAAVRRAEELLQERGPFGLEVREVPHRDEHEHGQCEFKVDVRFPWMRSANCVLKLELLPSPPEVIVGTPQVRDLLHVGFDERLEAKIRCYELREIVAEKLRGFLQTGRRFDELAAGKRTFVLARSRDLFDLAQLYRQTTYPIDWASVRKFLEPKAKAYGLAFAGLDDFLDSRVLDGMRRNWDGQLADFVSPLQAFDECLATHEELLGKVFS